MLVSSSTRCHGAVLKGGAQPVGEGGKYISCPDFSWEFIPPLCHNDWDEWWQQCAGVWGLAMLPPRCLGGNSPGGRWQSPGRASGPPPSIGRFESSRCCAVGTRSVLLLPETSACLRTAGGSAVLSVEMDRSWCGHPFTYSNVSSVLSRMSLATQKLWIASKQLLSSSKLYI